MHMDQFEIIGKAQMNLTIPDFHKIELSFVVLVIFPLEQV